MLALAVFSSAEKNLLVPPIRTTTNSLEVAKQLITERMCHNKMLACHYLLYVAGRASQQPHSEKISFLLWIDNSDTFEALPRGDIGCKH
jgi:hypothetical protein